MNNIPSNTTENGTLIFYLEGLPGCGKTSILELMSKNYLICPEIIIQENISKFHNLSNQSFFLENDEQKQRIAEKSNATIIVDRSPLSTFFFNLAKHTIDNNHYIDQITKWFNETIRPKIMKPNCHFIVLDIPAKLSLIRKNRNVNMSDPWANPITLALIRKMYIEQSTRYPSKFILINGKLKLPDILLKVQKNISKYENR